MVSVTAASITFVDAVARGFRRIADFRGRATRAEFWYWILFIVLVRMVTATVDGFLYPADLTATVSTTDLSQAVSQLSTMIQHSLWSTTFAGEILLLVPTVAVTVRRFRDSGWKPWLAVAAYIVNYGGLVLTLTLTTRTLALLTVAGDPATTTLDPELVVLLLAFLVIAAVDCAALIVLLVGALRPSRSNDTA